MIDNSPQRRLIEIIVAAAYWGLAGWAMCWFTPFALQCASIATLVGVVLYTVIAAWEDITGQYAPCWLPMLFLGIPSPMYIIGLMYFVLGLLGLV